MGRRKDPEQEMAREYSEQTWSLRVRACVHRGRRKRAGVKEVGNEGEWKVDEEVEAGGWHSSWL